MGSYSNAITLQMVAIPYPGRGHINQMLNFCKSVSLKRPNFLITFVVTEEWLGLLGSDPDDHRRCRNIRFATIPNVVPSEKVRAGDHMGFVEAVFTKMEGPVERLLDRLEPPEPRVIVYDSFVKWVLGVARRRDIPAASLWPMSATQFTLLYHWDTLVVNGQLPVNPLEHGEHNLTCIPGIPSTRIADIPKVMLLDGKSPVIQELPKLVHLADEADYLLFASVYELESEAIDSLREHVPSQIYTTGLAIPSLVGKEIETSATSTKNITNDHVSWLDAQPSASVLYISQGSFLSASPEQLEEFVAGVCQSGIRFFWVARENLDRFREQIDRECGNGLVVSWCDQLRVLCHPSIGGFWSHCGWNSAKEAAFSGVPVLASPISFDQFTNRRQIVEDWRTGWRLMGDDGRLVKREEIANVLKRFMDSECGEVKEMRKKAVEISEICKNAGSEFGSSELQIEAFIRDISSIEVQKQN